MTGPRIPEGGGGTTSASNIGDVAMPGGNWKVPAEGRPMDHVRAMIDAMGVPKEAQSEYLQALVRENGPPQPNKVLRLPPMQSTVPQASVEEELPPDRWMTSSRSPQAMSVEDSGTGPTVEARGGASVNLRGGSGNNRTQQSGTTRTVTPTQSRVDVRAEANKLGEAVRTNDTRAMYEVFHGRSKSDQQAIIRAFNRLPIARDTEKPMVNASLASPVGGPLLNLAQRAVGATRTQRNDFNSRLERMDDRVRARINAYIRNPSSRLETHDKLYFCMKGWGTYEGGINYLLGQLENEAEVGRVKRDYFARYKDFRGTLENAVREELSGIDEAQAIMHLRGREANTEYHRLAFQLYSYGDGKMGTDNVPMFALLEREVLEDESGQALARLSQASKDLFGDDYNLYGELDAEVRDITDPRMVRDMWSARLEAVARRDGAGVIQAAKARYVAHSARLYLMGGVEWDEMSGILSRYVDPEGRTGPTLAQVESEFKAAGEWGDMTDRMKFRGREVGELIGVLERGANTTDSPEALAVQFYHYTVGDGWGTKEKEGCDLLARTDADTRRLMDAAFRRMYEMGVEDAIRSDYGDSPAWMERALDHWNNGALPAESLVHHVTRGAGEESEVVRAINALPPAERAGVLERYEAAHPSGLDTTPADQPRCETQLIGDDICYRQLIGRMESRFRHWGSRGKGLDSQEARVENIGLARSFGAQVRDEILRSRGNTALQHLAMDENLTATIKERLVAANEADRADGRIKDENLDRAAEEIAAQIRGDYASFSPGFELALATMDGRTQRDIRSSLAVAQVREQGVDALLGAVSSNLGFEREGTGWNAVSQTLMDRFGWTGEFVDEAARDFFLSVDRATADGEISHTEMQDILDRYGEFHHFVKEYQQEKDEVGETAGDIAAAAAAVCVSVASGGTATPLVVTLGAAAAGTAKVGTEAAFKGGDYQLGSEEFWKDLVVGGVDGAVTVYTAGMSKMSTGAKFGRAVLIEANAAGLGSAAALGTRTAVDEHNWDDGFVAGTGNVVRSLGIGYGTGFAIGGGFSALLRGGVAGWTALSRSQLDDRAAAQLGKGNSRVITAGDLHSAAGDTAQIFDDIPAGQRVMINGDLMSKMDEGMVQIGDRAGWRHVMTRVRNLADKADVQITVGNHEEVFFAALDNPTLYDDPARASLSRDFALRRLLGKPSTNFAKSMLEPYGVRGTAQMGRALRGELARDLRAALRTGQRELSEESVQRLTTLAAALEDVNTPIPKSVLKGFIEAEDDLASLLRRGALRSAVVDNVPVECGPHAASRRYITVLQSTLTAADDAEAAAKYMFLKFADAGGDMTQARTAIADAARRLHVSPATLSGQMDGMAAFADDAAWLKGKLTGIQIDPESGMLMVHAGWPFEVGPDGQTILRPDKVIDYQRNIQQGRFLAVADPEAYHLNPSWAGESVTLDPVTGKGRRVAGLQEFSFVRSDVTAQSYDDAFAAFNRSLKQDPELMRSLGLNPDTFEGVGFMLSGHENVRNDWMRRRAAALVARYGLDPADARAAAKKEVGRMDPRDLMAEQLDELHGSHPRTDFGGEDGTFAGREAGGRHNVRPDGTIRTERVATSVDGLTIKEAGREVFERQSIRLTPEGAIELTAPARRREAQALRALLRQEGVSDAEVTRVLEAIAPGASPEEAMERFVVEFYRTVGKNEGAVLDAVAGGLGVSGDKVALELAKPVDGFRILAAQPNIRSDYATQFLLGRSLRTAAMGMVDMRPSTVGFAGIVRKANEMVARYPGSSVTRQGPNWVEVALDVNGVKSAIRLTGEAQSPYVLIAAVPAPTASGLSQAERDLTDYMAADGFGAVQAR